MKHIESHCPRFGHQLDTSGGASLAGCARECARVLRPGRRAVFLINEARRGALHAALGASGGPGAAGGLLALCERPCPLGFTKAVIVVCELRAGSVIECNVRDSGSAESDAAGVVSSSLPWEGKGRRSAWSVLR